ncbi:type II secretion system F family protein [Nocardioides pocheonensis]|uniref:Type II secretion system protein n=1 Tax=Nocardioides pocheonensis TaxID=661485 RepID=A0A3N0GQH7_9ACTN|nr:type II secretion system F family protein [Nocardioides pocheonensis]RNM14677.1 type II secretion system protein [Nocardioides pocheonensis]
MSPAAASAAVCAAAAGALLVRAPALLRPVRPRPWPRRAAPVALLVAGAAASVALLDGVRLVLVLIVGAASWAAAREVRRARRRVSADRRADLVLGLCDGLAADLRAGQPPVSAVTAAVEDWPELAPVAAAARLGADVPHAFRELSRQPGAAQLRVVAAAWHVGQRSGAGLADSLAAAADQVRAERSTSRTVATELAAAQATARLLAALPLGVLLLGSGLGGDPIGFLLGTAPGLACLGVGLSLEYAGLCWLARIGDQVTGRGRR